MAKLQNPQNNIDAIRQDYRDKHASAGAVLVCRKYPEPKQLVKDGQPVFDKNGNPVMLPPWYEAKSLTVNEDEYIDESKFYSESLKNDCYATINHFPVEYPPDVFKAAHPGHKYRTADNAQYLTGFYIDFDYKAIHGIAKNQQASSDLVDDAQSYADFIVHTLVAYLQDDFGMPAISYTGAGYGFYFRIKPLLATAENKALYIAVYEKLYRIFNILFAELLDIFENDHAVVGGIERVIRITGTYNSKTGTFARYIARYGKDYGQYGEIYQYSIDDIVSLYHLDDIILDEENACLVTTFPLPRKREERKEKKRETVDREAISDVSPLSSCTVTAPAMATSQATGLAYTNRNDIIYPIKWYQGWCHAKQLGGYLDLCERSLQYLDDRGSLQRNNALFLAACLRTEIEYAKYGYHVLEQALGEIQCEITRYMMHLNDSLATPLDAEELADILDHAGTIKYHFRKLGTIQKYLNLTDAEFDSLGWLDHRKREEQGKERQNALVDLDREVIKLYLSGLSDAKIAAALGISKRQSVRIRQRLGVMDRTTKFEDVDFDGNKRYTRHSPTVEAPEPTPIFPYMPWYTPTDKYMYVRGYRTGNPVANRAKVLVAHSGGKVAESAMQFERSMEHAVDRIVNMSAEEKRKILACFDAAQAQEQRKTDLINQKQRYYGECYDEYRENYKKKYGMEFWEDIG